jgi:DNA primase
MMGRALPPPRDDLVGTLVAYQSALPPSVGTDYLRSRGIPLELAQRYGVGYAARGKWAHTARDWKWGRLVFPHTDPNGCLVNLYGRAVGANEKVPTSCRHDHLPGGKGYFNGLVLSNGTKEPLFVTESPFCALSLIAAGYPRTVAIFGVGGWRWEWAHEVQHLVFAMDADAAGQDQWRVLARDARLRGKVVGIVPPEAYGGRKDVNEACIAGVLNFDA